MAHEVTLPQPSTGAPPATKTFAPAIVIGTALEFFDMFLYASMAAMILAPIFFPSHDPMLGTIASVATFAVGYLARPFGGIIFGALGDKLGRKSVLVMTFVLMGLATGCIGLVPSYASIGIAAPILLVVFRILQGLGAGAEAGVAFAAGYEYADPSSRARMASLPALGGNIGLFAASMTMVGLTSLPDDILYTWGWRIPFVASFALVGFGIWVRRRMPETPVFEEVVAISPEQKKARPLIDLLKHDWRGWLVVAVMIIGYSGSSYIFKTFSLTYLTKFRDVPANISALGIAVASAAAIVTVPIAGRLSDRVDAKRVLMFGAIGTGVMAFPFFWLLNTGNTVYICVALVLVTGFFVPTMLAASGAFMARQFPARVRASGITSSREISSAVAGGFSPLVALGIVSATPNHATWGVSVLIVVGAVLVLGSAACDQYRRVEARTATSQPEETQRATV